MNKLKHKAAKAFKCSPYQTKYFSCYDPFNSDVQFEGFRCTKKGKMGGSLFITKVNNVNVEPQLIYGTPKLEYPYEQRTREEIERQRKDNTLKSERVYKTKFFDEARQYFFSKKWNGCNILFFKYKDDKGKTRITAKTKGFHIVNDSAYGDFLTLTYEALGKVNLAETIPDILKPLMEDEKIQSMSFELCGRKEPHLVLYDFDIDLKPLFYTYYDGRIKPVILNNPEEEIGPLPYSYEEVIQKCKELQARDLELNKKFREERNLPHKYEYEHFVTEGYVLYLLDEEGYIIERTMYKVKPEDIEEVHWASFDDNRKALVKLTLKKMKQRDMELNEKNMQDELDMGPKEWGKFGEEIMIFARQEWRKLTKKAKQAAKRAAKRAAKKAAKKAAQQTSKQAVANQAPKRGKKILRYELVEESKEKKAEEPKVEEKTEESKAEEQTQMNGTKKKKKPANRVPFNRNLRRRFFRKSGKVVFIPIGTTEETN